MEEDLDRDEDGVSRAPVEAALLEAGGLASCNPGSSRRTGSREMGIGGALRMGVACSLFKSGDNLGFSGAAGLRLKLKLKRGCDLSREIALRPPGGGGGNTGADTVSGERLCTTGEISCAFANIDGS